MAYQEQEGWPLGLRPVNARMRPFHRHQHVSTGSISFGSVLSPSRSSLSSSDLDSQSMGSFFRDKSYTLGNLIGISSFLELSRRSNRTRIDQTCRNIQHQKNLKFYKPWIFSICSKLTTNTILTKNKTRNDTSNHEGNNGRRNNTKSLGHFLMVERRAIRSTTPNI